MLRVLFFCVILSTNLIAQPDGIEGFWEEASRSVSEGDFEAYAATFHKEAVLVNGISKTSFPIQQALDSWEQGFNDTKDGKMKAEVEFRFSDRFHGETAAHEIGMFRYWWQNEGEDAQEVFIHFEMLLTKSTGVWTVLMEYQKSLGTEDEWAKLE